jgi:hypothetical protein
MLTIIVRTSLDAIGQILTTSDRNSSYFRSDEIVDDVYDGVAREYIQNRTGEFKKYINRILSNISRPLDSTTHQHSSIRKSPVCNK